MRAVDLTHAALQCHECGYDLRGHGRDGKCPECGAAVEDSRRLAAMPRRPTWRDSDPRWRRRMLAGAWILVLVPLMRFLETSGWAVRASVPTPLDLKGAVTLKETFSVWTYEYLAFCVGVVLLFSRERDRRPGRLDRARHWGVMTSYVVFLLGIPHFALVAALVVVGIAALFLSIPPPYQPAVTGLLIDLGSGYLYYGPHPSELSEASLCAFSSVAMMLACVPLYNALRSSGPKALAALILAPLFMASVMHLNDIGRYSLGLISGDAPQTYYPFYFDPRSLLQDAPDPFFPKPSFFRFAVELGKWAACLTVAIWLSVAGIMARRRCNKVSPDPPPSEVTSLPQRG